MTFCIERVSLLIFRHVITYLITKLQVKLDMGIFFLRYQTIENEFVIGISFYATTYSIISFQTFYSNGLT